MTPAVTAIPPGRSRLAELLCALSFGSGLAGAERMEHGTNTAFVGTRLGRTLGLVTEDLEAIFYGALLKDVGCGPCGALLAPFFTDDQPTGRLDFSLVDMHSPGSMLMWAKSQLRMDHSLPGRLARLAAFASQCGSVAHETMAAHCEIAADFATRLGFGGHVQDAVHYQHERYDGRGAAFGLRGEMIPVAARVLHLAIAADLVRSLAGADKAAAMVRQRAGSHYGPDVAEAYIDIAGSLWPSGDDPVPLTDVFSCDPGTPADDLPGDRRLAVCEALADFADLKSPGRDLHSHAVASLAAQAAARLGLSMTEQDRLRRAGLVHDLGKIAVPYRLLKEAADGPGSSRRATAALEEPIRLHPYYAQRILSRVEPLADLAADVVAHHERLDGSGYPLGIGGQQVLTGARVLAAADIWAGRAAHGTLDLADEDGLDPEVVGILRSCSESGFRRELPNIPAVSLSPREHEVLRLLAEGASNPDISRALHISRRTAEHHVEHILAKLTVTSRTAAVAYALTHELIG